MYFYMIVVVLIRHFKHETTANSAVLKVVKSHSSFHFNNFSFSYEKNIIDKNTSSHTHISL